MSDTSDELNALRDDIDRIDDEIVASVAERVATAEDVAEVKSLAERNLVDSEREEAVKSHYEELFRRRGLTAECGRDLAEFLIEISLERERQIESDF